ncbi:unnamed protein product [Penicillium salamii]|uniref:Glutamine amidotransferase domain-containing protein n=1 Tax=Penicillium salamii TaxID=1612424 RepID=A0A9W4JV79_9EURO|nr:unnamed protein product [Penicillium salamii]CAG8397194.1 unnamed protein product [Penicillium salamii]CAG8416349.1 unnamed protein product [Penicillium salamii]CAG8421659.1 unnamed protein product [Penicillium salamii]
MISYASGLGVALCPRVPTIGFPRLFGFGFRHLTSLPILRLHSRHNSSLYTAANMELIKNPKIAVLINTPPDGTDFPSVVKECFREAFKSILPTEELDFFDPVVERKFPDASKYQLIVLSGGKIDADCSEPWVLGVLDYIRSTAHNFSKTKMLAVCWGHQAVSRAFGGQVRNVPTGSVNTVKEIGLTETGKKFFPFASTSGFYRVMAIHDSEVETPAPGFVSLAENQECFINDANTILTFQAHPEISHELSWKLLLEEDQKHNRAFSAEKWGLDHPNDGLKLLERVVQWAAE